MPKPKYTFRVERRVDGKWDVYVDAANGNLFVFSTQGYENKQDLLDVLARFRTAVANGEIRVTVDP